MVRKHPTGEYTTQYKRLLGELVAVMDDPLLRAAGAASAHGRSGRGRRLKERGSIAKRTPSNLAFLTSAPAPARGSTLFEHGVAPTAPVRTLALANLADNPWQPRTKS